MVRNGALLLTASLLLAACGGGSSGGGGVGGISLKASARSASTIYLSWSRPENLEVSHYLVARDDDQLSRTIGSTSERNYLVAGLQPNTRYCFVLKDPIFALVISNRACATTDPDTTAPSVPTNLTATATSPVSIDVSWFASFDADGISGYRVYRDSSLITTVSSGVRYTDDTVEPGVEYCYRVSGVDHSGNESGQSAEACALTALDVEPPSTPQGLWVDYQDDNGTPTMTVHWTPSTDNSRVERYTITRDGVETGDITTPPYVDSDVQDGATYCYSVIAIDIAGNVSAASETACGRTGWGRQPLGVAYPGAAVIALDSSGAPWVAYKDRYFDYGRFEYRSRLQIGAIGDTFAPQLLDESPAYDYISGEFDMDFVLDDNDVTNILHQSTPQLGSAQLDHVTRSDTAVAAVPIRTSIDYLEDASLARDASGVLHACIGFGNRLYYGENSTGAWTLTELGGLGGDSRGSTCSIAVTADGSVHLAYLEFFSNDLWYLTNASGAWTAEMIDQQSGTSTNTIYHTAIALDSGGFAHIVYAHDYAENDLEYASNRSGSWVVEKVDDSGTVGYRSDIVVDSLDRVSIVYQQIDSGSRSTRFASRETGSWESYLLSSASTGPLSAAVDSADRLHVVLTASGGELTHLTRN